MVPVGLKFVRGVRGTTSSTIATPDAREALSAHNRSWEWGEAVTRAITRAGVRAGVGYTYADNSYGDGDGRPVCGDTDTLRARLQVAEPA